MILISKRINKNFASFFMINREIKNPKKDDKKNNKVF